MQELSELFENNRLWASGKLEKDPQTFERLVEGQAPRFLWIGCSDSRIPANEILGLGAGDVFVHRNIANLCLHIDFNFLSVLQFGIDYFGIEHVIVCGHYQCGGVAAAMEKNQLGLLDNWLRHIRDVYFLKREELDACSDQNLKYNRLVELNVIHQVMNVSHTTIVQNAWESRKKLCVHGWIYDISTGLLKDLNCSIRSLDQIEENYRTLKPHQ